MADTTILEVSEILESFDTEEFRKLINEQIPLNPEENMYASQNADYFKPLYIQYRKMADTAPDEAQIEISARFKEICLLYIERICKKFRLEFNLDWIEENMGRLPSVTMALYSFFILDFKNTLEEVLLKYIYANKPKIKEAFSNLENKKDSQSQVNRKIIPDEDMVLIASHIFDVTKWILSQMDADEFFDYCDDGYIAGAIVNELLDKIILNGQPMEAIQELYDVNLSLRSTVGFDLICHIRKRYSPSTDEK